MVLQRTILWFGIFIIVMVTITKFMFICVWKSMRTMNDGLLIRIAVNQALLFSSIIGLLKIQAQVSTLDSGIDVAPGINVDPGTFVKNIKHSP